jgi:hypothetical protein
MWLAATFAASAVKIFDGRGKVAGCSGLTDSGLDADAQATLANTVRELVVVDAGRPPLREVADAG